MTTIGAPVTVKSSAVPRSRTEFIGGTRSMLETKHMRRAGPSSTGRGTPIGERPFAPKCLARVRFAWTVEAVPDDDLLGASARPGGAERAGTAPR